MHAQRHYMSSTEQSAGSLSEIVRPVQEKMARFNSEETYLPETIKSLARGGIKFGEATGIQLLADGDNFKERIHGDTLKLLIFLVCDQFVRRALEPDGVRKKRVPKHQKEFEFDLQAEFYYLKNGRAMCSGWR